MSELIYKQDAITELVFNEETKDIKCEDMKKVLNVLKKMPSAQPLTAYVVTDEDGNIKCSNCGSFECWGNYCMDCGADMRGDSK